MTYGQLLEFIQGFMHKGIEHIYLPLVVGELVDSNGSATIRQLAESALTKDERQVIYYENLLKEVPLPVLSELDVISIENNLVSLNVTRLTLEQRSQIKILCEKALREYLVREGPGIWDYRLLDSDPNTDSLRYRVLKESNDRCAVCGATNEERPLDVGFIKPRSGGGKKEYENLQVLCSKCNRSMGNRDDSDFRDDLIETVFDCPFCYHNVQGEIIEEYNSVFAIEDRYPVSKGHYLVIPKHHSTDYFFLTDVEKQDADKLIRILCRRLMESDKTITGFNIGMNSGESSGQTIFHCHTHIIPRRDGDTPLPRGGVRGVIPDKMNYSIT